MYKLWNKAIKRISYILTHKKTLSEQTILGNLKSNENYVKEDNDYYYLENTEFSYQLRKKGSDVRVHRQIVIEKEYQSLIDCLIVNDKKPKLIVDCGANIGLTAIQFARNFPYAQIISIEPDEMNFRQLSINTQDFHNVYPLRNAIWTSLETLKLDKNFRDGEDWSIRTVKSSDDFYQEVQTITLLDLLKELGQEKIDLLKIDIEGTEKELFKDKNTYRFLDKTECIAIEIHDECVDRLNIYKILREHDFTLFNSGELTIGLRK
ncbi:FkbM family methyltransferase [Pedobacter chitinilyticus]|uniref:FkbM family methyltransferase n=1 Tax=Pedobacter chitinilyticus TaxID=2233776 RepID=A0A443YX84_9SPHI|nr:FkbM family methyltransferase [Pedobacter chitinilyticus]RWU08599.1 FkbM family methyltransferase [Pedobacter chitinilyticus]